jgi:hypothetical protein
MATRAPGKLRIALEQRLGDLFGPVLLDKVEGAVTEVLASMGHEAFDFVAGLVYQPPARTGDPDADADTTTPLGYHTLSTRIRWAILRAAAGTSHLTDLDIVREHSETTREVVCDMARYELLSLTQVQLVLSALDLPSAWLADAGEVVGQPLPTPVHGNAVPLVPVPAPAAPKVFQGS